MTAEKQYVDDFANEYRGKKWSIFAIIGIMILVCFTIAIRDIGMVFVYGSIYDKFADGGANATVSIFSYVFMILLYIIPLIIPAIFRFTKGAYYDEPQTTLLPSFNSKILNALVYIVVVAVGIVPVVLCITGVFTTAYMFVACNIALLLLSTVAIFYYFGTYLLQRAKKGLVAKYILTNVMMVLVSGAALAMTAIVILLLSLIGVNVPLVEHLKGFLESWEMSHFIMQAITMFVTVSLAVLISGLIYNYTQNMLYSVLPTFTLSFANVILFQRAREAYNFIQTTGAQIDGHLAKIDERLAKIATAEEKIANLDPASKKYATNLEKYTKEIEKANKDIVSFKEKITGLEADLPVEKICMVLCYVLVAVMIVLLAAVGTYALARLIVHLVETAKAKKAKLNK